MKGILVVLSISIAAIYIASIETGMAFANDSTAPTPAPERIAESPTQDFSPSESEAESPAPDYSPEDGPADSLAPDYSPAADSAESPAPDSSLPGYYDVTYYGALADGNRESSSVSY
ncbi:hypothetical protein L6164_012506 [Bauhinia variegata]|uniref:Uncharacterized protein n=1 Tax=Bauhinia variegata TaxID=167791 RepID=A0ACB9PD53_BAUVA|nr:hypothetical protein L6164_012506 [Bauhinia variegata]